MVVRNKASDRPKTITGVSIDRERLYQQLKRS
jgi:hypothetical protein